MRDSHKNRPGASDFILAVLGVIFFIGILTFLKPCGPTEEGNWMTCHWAGRAVAGATAVILVLSMMHLFVDGRIRIGLDIAIAALSVLVICIPGHLISLCMMQGMRCRAVMTPGVTVLAALSIFTAAADAFLQRKKVAA